MKKKYWMRIVPLLAGVLLIICMVRSCYWKKPPSVNRIEAIFQRNRDDIQYVTEWLLNLENQDVFFWREFLDEGEAWADFSHISLEPEILDRVKRLMETKGVFLISKSSSENAIAFYMMTDNFEADCGVLYAIDSTRVPCVAYQISLEPISEWNWFYFYSDYNKWRVLQTSIPGK